MVYTLSCMKKYVKRNHKILKIKSGKGFRYKIVREDSEFWVPSVIDSLVSVKKPKQEDLNQQNSHIFQNMWNSNFFDLNQQN